jgi:hypothetical protein
VRLGILIVGLMVFGCAAAQEAKKKAPPAKKAVAHAKATPEQIRRFNQLQKQKK